MKRELRDELELPGHVVMIKSISREDATIGIKQIMAKAETRGCNKLKELTRAEKDEIIQYFDVLGLPHNNLEE